jgi:hypothetical protein
MATTADVENKIRDLINWVRVKQEELVDVGHSRIDDETADQLCEKLEEIATVVGQLE